MIPVYFLQLQTGLRNKWCLFKNGYISMFAFEDLHVFKNITFFKVMLKLVMAKENNHLVTIWSFSHQSLTVIWLFQVITFFSELTELYQYNSSCFLNLRTKIPFWDIRPVPSILLVLLICQKVSLLAKELFSPYEKGFNLPFCLFSLLLPSNPEEVIYFLL